MSRLLYAEPGVHDLGREYELQLLGIIIFVVVLLLLAYATVVGIVEGKFEASALGVLTVLAGFVFLVFLIYVLVIWMLTTQRFEIYDDRIELPSPRKPSLKSHKPDTIWKSDVKTAEFKYEEIGRWGITFVLKNGETFYLNWFRVQCEEECVPALKEFLKGLEE